MRGENSNFCEISIFNITSPLFKSFQSQWHTLPPASSPLNAERNGVLLRHLGLIFVRRIASQKRTWPSPEKSPEGKPSQQPWLLSERLRISIGRSVCLRTSRRPKTANLTTMHRYLSIRSAKVNNLGWSSKGQNAMTEVSCGHFLT